jgi:hypothetical protein
MATQRRRGAEQAAAPADAPRAHPAPARTPSVLGGLWQMAFPREFFVSDEPVPDFSGLPFIMRWRWVFVIVFLFPLSVLFDMALALRKRFHTPTPSEHSNRVRRVQEQVSVAGHAASALSARQVRARPKGKPVCTDRPSWMAMSLRPNLYKNELRKVRIHDLNDILSVDTEAMLVRVEPFVTVGQLTAELVRALRRPADARAEDVCCFLCGVRRRSRVASRLPWYRNSTT